MKKLIVVFCLISTIIITNMLSIEVYANDNDKDNIKSKIIENKLLNEKEDKIVKAIDSFNNNKESFIVLGDDNASEMKVKSYNTKEALTLYILPDLFLSKYSKEGGLGSLISDESQISVTVTFENGDKGISTLSFDENGEAEVLGITSNLRQDSIIPDFDTLTDIIYEKVTKVKDIKFAHSFRYYTTFVIIETKDNEYVVPYSQAPDMVGLNNGEIYSSEEAVEIMASIFDEEAALTAGDTNGGTPIKSQMNLFPMLLIITLALAMLTILSVKRMRKAN